MIRKKLRLSPRNQRLAEWVYHIVQPTILCNKPFSASLFTRVKEGECGWGRSWPPHCGRRGLIGPISLCPGAHLNPAVTFAMCFLAREPWIKLPVYTLAQTLGAFLGAGIIFGLYYGEYSHPAVLHDPLPLLRTDLLAPGLSMTNTRDLPRPRAYDSFMHRPQVGAVRGKK